MCPGLIIQLSRTLNGLSWSEQNLLPFLYSPMSHENSVCVSQSLEGSIIPVSTTMANFSKMETLSLPLDSALLQMKFIAFFQIGSFLMMGISVLFIILRASQRGQRFLSLFLLWIPSYILSRILHFSNSQIYWELVCASCCSRHLEIQSEQSLSSCSRSLPSSVGRQERQVISW